jgi:hypothetical protein
LDEAKQAAAAIRASLPDLPDWSDPLQAHIATDALAAELHVPRAMLKKGDVQGAAAELDRLARYRPPFADLPNGTIMVQRGPSRFGWSPKTLQEQAWRAYDALWWDVHDATTKK